MNKSALLPKPFGASKQFKQSLSMNIGSAIDTIQNLLNDLTHLVPVCIIRVDVNWNCVYANDKWCEFSGQSYEESDKYVWVNAIHRDDVDSLLENLRETLQAGADFHSAFRLVSTLGQTRWMDFNAQALFDEQGMIQVFLATVAEITKHSLDIDRLRLALQNQRFFLVYQPQSRVDNSDIVGFEALLRFKDEDNAVVLPEKFILILEETSMIIEVGKWVIEKSCQQIQQWMYKGGVSCRWFFVGQCFSQATVGHSVSFHGY